MRKKYDHRLRNLYAETQNPNLFPNLKIPRSTIRDWIRKGPIEVISTPEFGFNKQRLIQEVECLKGELRQVKAKANLVIKSFSILGFCVQFTRVPEATAKASLIEAIVNASKDVKLAECLQVIGLSAARFHSWMRKLKKCELNDQSSCPKTHLTKLMFSEVAKIKELVSSRAYQHFSIASLSMYAKREKIVSASAATWHRIIREYGLRRSFKRLYPSKPTIGIRASSPNEIWHMDQSIIKLTDGTKCFIQAIIDNRLFAKPI